MGIDAMAIKPLLKFKEKTVEGKYSENLKINQAKISEELAEQASNFLWSAEEAVNAEVAYDKYKLKVNELYAVVDRAVRAKAEEEGKKVTERVVENQININPDYRAAQSKLLRLKAEKGIAKARQEAWHMRKDLVLQIARQQARELDALGHETVRQVV